MGTPWASIAKALYKSKGVKTQDIIETKTTGKLPTFEQLDETTQAQTIVKPTDLEGGLPSSRSATARNINFDNIQEPDEILTVIDNIGSQHDEFIKARGGVVSHEQTIIDAAKIDLESILGFKLGDGVTPSRITGGRIALVDSAKSLSTKADTVLSGKASTAEMLAFRQAVSTHVGIQQSVAGMSAEAGRSLNAFRIPIQAGMATGENTAIFRSQLQEAFERSGGQDNIYKLAEYIKEAGDDLAEIGKRTKEVQNSTSGDVLLEIWINGLLSSPATHMVNTVSNAVVAGWAIPERLLASGFNKLFRSEKGVEPQEALAQLYGIIYGARDGLSMAWQVLKTGDPSDPAMKMEARQYKAITASKLGVNNEGYIAKGIDLFGDFIRIPGRFLGAEDEFFKSIGYRMELNALAYRKAIGEGLEGDELAKRIVDIVQNPTDEIHLAASDIARVQTFTNPLGVTGQTVQKLANSHPMLKLVMPFVRTPMNIVKYVGERSPLAPLAKSFRADMKAGGAARDMALSKMSLGSTLMMTGVSLSIEGRITGGGPKDTAMRNALRRQGWQPYSIKFGDTWYSFNRTDPVGMFLGLSADVTEIMKYAEDDQDVLDIATAATMAMAKNLTSKTYLRGLSDTMATIADPDRYLEGYLKRQSATFVPYTSLVANIERSFDPTSRATYTIIEQIQSRTPGWSDTLPPRRNLWGEPIVLQGGLGWDFVSPIYTSEWKPNIVDDEIYNHEVPVSMPKRKLGTGRFAITLSPNEYDRYVVLAGKELKLPYTNEKTGKTTNIAVQQYLKNVIMSDMYSALTDGPDGGKAETIKMVVNAFRGSCSKKGCSGATGQLLQEYPDLKAEWLYQQQLKVEKKYGERIQLGQ